MTLHDDGPDPADASAWGGTGKSKPRATLVATRLVPIGRRAIPPRPWAYGKFLLFGSAAVIGAVDGGGKGFICTGMIIAMITGQPILGEKVWRSGPVAIISYEDDEMEWHRRIAAACEYYHDEFHVDYETVIANVIFINAINGKVSFAKAAADRTLCSDADEIIDLLKENGAAMLVIDPFNHAHAMEDGNNNPMIAKVAYEMARVAAESNAAVLVLHHLRKGNTGQADDLMGATSLRATFRSCRILCRMTQDVAAKMGLTDAWRYIRIAGSKENLAPPPDQSTWFKLESVALENGNDEYPDGDSMGVATTWIARPTFEGMDADTLRDVFEELMSGPSSPSKQSRNLPWAGQPLIRLGKRNQLEATRIIAAWIQSGLLVEIDHWVKNNKVKAVTLNDEKCGEILASIYTPNDPPSPD